MTRVETVLLGMLGFASLVSVAVSQSLMGVLAVWLAVRAVRERPRPVGFELMVGLFVGWCLLMIPFSTDPAFSLGKAHRFAVFSALWIGALTVDRDGRRRVLLWSLAAAAALNAVISLATEEYSLQEGHRRLTLLQGSAMTGAWLMAAVSIVLTAFLVTLRGRRDRVLLALAQAPVLAALLFTRTRSAWLGVLAGWTVIFLLKQKRLIPVLGVAVVLGLALAPAEVKDRVRSIGDPAQSSNNERLVQWRAAVELIRWKPVTGVGDVYLRDVMAAHTSYENTRDADHHHLHQSYLTTAVFWGIPAAVLLVALLGRLLWLLGRGWRRRTEATSWQEGWILAGIGVWVLYAMVGMIDSTVIDVETSLVCLLAMGTGIAGSRGQGKG